MSTAVTGPRTGASSGLLVLGMHRSGTSVLTRLLQAAGASLGERLVPGSKGNEEGHWEDAFAVECNERLLTALGYTWDDPRPLPEGWLQSAAARQAAAEIRDYAGAHLLHKSLWALKDPRLCRLAPLWLAALREAGCAFDVVLMSRHPLEVAASLAARDGIARSKGQLSWLRHTLEAEQGSRGAARCFIDYDALLADPAAVLRRIQALPHGQALSLSAAQAALADIVRPQQRHHRADAAIAPIFVQKAWQALQSGDEAQLSTALAAVANALRQADALFAPVLEDERRHEQSLWQRTARAEAEVATGLATMTQVPDELRQLRERVELGERATLEAMTRHVEGMQREHARLLQEAAQLQGQLGMALGELEHARARQVVFDAANRELARLRYEIGQLRSDAEILQWVKQTWSWRLTAPFRVAARLMGAKGLGQGSETARLRDWSAEQLAGSEWLPEGARQQLLQHLQPEAIDGAPALKSLPDQAHLEGVRLAPAAADKPDVFVWSVIDWHFRIQRPQHLARELAKRGHRVFYLSNHFVDSAEPGFRVEALDDDGRLFQLHLNVAGAPVIYFAGPEAPVLQRLRQSLAEVLRWSGSAGAIALVQHPFWRELAWSLPNSRWVYDCMDHHAGFDNNSSDILTEEARLIAGSDLVVVTSAWLEQELAGSQARRALIRNAGEYGHFADSPEIVNADARGRRVLGYYGAIAEWFDLELVRKLAQRFPDCLIRLIGNDTVQAGAALADLANVEMIGETPYAQLPAYLHGFDVALLPFRVIPLTLATNPVKVYEYLAAGKPVVSVDLPEMAQFGALVARAASHEAFLDAVATEIAGPADAGITQQRKAFAREQTWEHRAEEFDAAMAGLADATASVIVVTYNNLDLTRACLDSLERCSDWPDLEVIVVDNASGDGSPEFLQSWQKQGPRRKLILNTDNRGFSAANNQGLQAASGDYLVLLNNDTQVTPGWLRTLLNHLRRDASIALVGPVTNNIGNEARIDIAYDDLAQMPAKAAEYTRRHPGQHFDIATLAFFCVAMPRATLERIGLLDESFGLGFFEDDDYCRRIEQAGLRKVCAEDVFVHHQLSASFDQLKAERRKELFERNKAIYEAKWGPWQPHAYRAPPGNGR